MTNLNLNITLSSDGHLMTDVFILTAISPDSHQRETLGVFAHKDIADKQSQFWTKVMDYTEPFIEFQVLRLN